MIIDLSMPVNEGTVVFPGDAKPVFEQAGTLETVGFVDHVVHMNNHLGTHIDAPDHMLKKGRLLSDYPIDRFVCEATCIDARGQAVLTADLLNGIDVQPNDAVLFYTARGDDYTQQSYATDYPAIDLNLAKLLVEKGVKLVGVDMISFDHEEPYPIHKALLDNDILLIENLVNLKTVVGKRFRLYALPVKLELHAAPARVVAEL
ncbi:MAG TPA: cyclase family protein [Candidatus Saccharibacteria bacterium]|nr:cyclase family protein [Candidatus Saccharibacteria bacterium]